MATQPQPGAPSESAPPESSESLSQFAARVLNQLSLVAWLPSGTLVLAMTFVLELNAVLTGKVQPKSANDAISRVFEAMTRISIGGALLLFAAVIVLTVLTQVFAFDAIQILQGYWGTLGIVEWVAKFRSTHFRNQCTSLLERYKKLTKEAWAVSRTQLERQRNRVIDRHDDAVSPPVWTPDMISYLGATLTGDRASLELTPGQREEAQRIPWRHFVPPDLLRRRLNLDKRIQDFPDDLSHIMPTRVGNILRAYWDQVREEAYGDVSGEASVQTFVLEIYGRLPSHLREQYREWRDRLDLYCSMVFVVAIISLLSAVVLGPYHWQYATAAILVGVFCMWLAYRAAVTTARHYGRLVLSMAKYSLPAVKETPS